MNLIQNFQDTQNASRKLINLSEEKINAVLKDLAKTIIENKNDILSANQKDCERMDKNDPKFDRLLLTEQRLEDIANDINNVSTLPCPINEILEEKTLPNGLNIKKIRVPLGVIGIIYEARPNVGFDVFSLCFKTKNACILKGGSDAKDSNEAIAKLIKDVLIKHEVDPNTLFLMPPDREYVIDLLSARNFVDVIIPRGSQGLIDFVVENSKIPVIETGAGICHTYFDKSADTKKGKDIITNAKTRRVSVCNALDTLIVHEDRLNDLPELTSNLKDKNVTIFADEKAYEILKDYPFIKHAEPEHFGTEFLDYKMSIKTVKNIDEAISHITIFSSKHSEAIIAEDNAAIEKFLNEVDASSVYANTSTAFTDGAQFGLGAEIGISTQKLHARGPMALKELCSYKWIIRGNGQTRT